MTASDDIPFETPPLETKAREPEMDAVSGPEVRAAMGEFLSAFEAFKDANDARLAALEAKSRGDVVLDEKVARIDTALTEQKAALDRMALEARRPAREATLRAPDERKAAFERYVRAGDATAITALEAKSLNFGEQSEGGYLAPEETEAVIARAVREVSPIRQIASVREIGAMTYRKPMSVGGVDAGWTAETGQRVEGGAPSLSMIEFPTMELYAMPAASQTLLDDAVVDVEQWLADEVQGEFAEQEGRAFVKGDGQNKPTGFLLPSGIAADATRTDKQIGYIATGEAGGFPANDPADVLLDLIYTPKQVYRANGRFVMNRQAVSAVRKFKDADGNYLWQPSAAAGAPSTLLGYPVTESEDMDPIDNDSHSIAFGDFARGYLIIDRRGVSILRDPYSAKPYVLFYTTKRVGGGVQDFDAIKVLKFSQT